MGAGFSIEGDEVNGAAIEFCEPLGLGDALLVGKLNVGTVVCRGIHIEPSFCPWGVAVMVRNYSHTLAGCQLESPTDRCRALASLSASF